MTIDYLPEPLYHPPIPLFRPATLPYYTPQNAEVVTHFLSSQAVYRIVPQFKCKPPKYKHQVYVRARNGSWERRKTHILTHFTVSRFPARISRRLMWGAPENEANFMKRVLFRLPCGVDVGVGVLSGNNFRHCPCPSPSPSPRTWQNWLNGFLGGRTKKSRGVEKFMLSTERKIGIVMNYCINGIKMFWGKYLWFLFRSKWNVPCMRFNEQLMVLYYVSGSTGSTVLLHINVLNT